LLASSSKLFIFFLQTSSLKDFLHPLIHTSLYSHRYVKTFQNLIFFRFFLPFGLISEENLLFFSDKEESNLLFFSDKEESNIIFFSEKEEANIIFFSHKEDPNLLFFFDLIFCSEKEEANLLFCANKEEGDLPFCSDLLFLLDLLFCFNKEEANLSRNKSMSTHLFCCLKTWVSTLEVFLRFFRSQTFGGVLRPKTMFFGNKKSPKKFKGMV
jgi:hypothetical protein